MSPSTIQPPRPHDAYTYYSGGTIPPDTTHLCIHSTVSVIPPELCYNRTNLVELELCATMDLRHYVKLVGVHSEGVLIYSSKSARISHVV